MAGESKKSRATPGRKGAATRARLMAAAREIIRDQSPMALTAISVSRNAGVASPSFYVYFSDVRALMLALAEDSAESLIVPAAAFDTPWPPDDLLGWSTEFVEDFVAAWRANAEILLYRNLEADRGDLAFDDARIRAGLPILTALTDRMIAAWPEGEAPRRVDCFAESVILYASLERFAAASLLPRKNQLQPHHYVAAFARMIAAAVQPRPDAAGLAPADPALARHPQEMPIR